MDPRAVELGLSREEWRIVQVVCSRFASSGRGSTGDYREDFEDFLQEVLIVLSVALPDHRIRNRRGFIYRVSISVLMNEVRKRSCKKRDALIVPLDDNLGCFEDFDIKDKIQDIDTWDRVRALLEGAPAEDLELIWRLFFVGDQQKDLAKEWDIAESTVSYRKKRILGELRDLWQAEG